MEAVFSKTIITIYILSLLSIFVYFMDFERDFFNILRLKAVCDGVSVGVDALFFRPEGTELVIKTGFSGEVFFKGHVVSISSPLGSLDSHTVSRLAEQHEQFDDFLKLVKQGQGVVLT